MPNTMLNTSPDILHNPTTDEEQEIPEILPTIGDLAVVTFCIAAVAATRMTMTRKHCCQMQSMQKCN